MSSDESFETMSESDEQHGRHRVVLELTSGDSDSSREADGGPKLSTVQKLYRAFSAQKKSHDISNVEQVVNEYAVMKKHYDQVVMSSHMMRLKFKRKVRRVKYLEKRCYEYSKKLEISEAALRKTKTTQQSDAIGDYKQKLTDFVESLQSVKEELESANKNVLTLQEEKEDLTRKVAVTESFLDQMDQKRQEHWQEEVHLRKKLSDSKTAQDELIAKMETLSNQVEELQHTITELQQKLAEANEHSAKLENDCKETLAKLESKSKEMVDYKVLTDDQKMQLYDYMFDIRHESKLLHRDLRMSQGKLEEAIKKNEAYENQIKELKAVNEALQQYEKKVTELTASNEILKQYEKKVTELTASNEILKSQVDQLKKTAKALEETNDRVIIDPTVAEIYMSQDEEDVDLSESPSGCVKSMSEPACENFDRDLVRDVIEFIGPVCSSPGYSRQPKALAKSDNVEEDVDSDAMSVSSSDEDSETVSDVTNQLILCISNMRILDMSNEFETKFAEDLENHIYESVYKLICDFKSKVFVPLFVNYLFSRQIRIPLNPENRDLFASSEMVLAKCLWRLQMITQCEAAVKDFLCSLTERIYCRDGFSRNGFASAVILYGCYTRLIENYSSCITLLCAVFAACKDMALYLAACMFLANPHIGMKHATKNEVRVSRRVIAHVLRSMKKPNDMEEETFHDIQRIFDETNLADRLREMPIELLKSIVEDMKKLKCDDDKFDEILIELKGSLGLLSLHYGKEWHERNVKPYFDEKRVSSSYQMDIIDYVDDLLTK